jgi:hypothetical protein
METVVRLRACGRFAEHELAGPALQLFAEAGRRRNGVQWRRKSLQ